MNTNTALALREPDLLDRVQQASVPIDRIQERVLKAEQHTRIADYDERTLVQEIGTFMKPLFRDLGISHEPERYDAARFMQAVREWFPTMTLAEVKLAFELHMMGKLPYEGKAPHHYQKFSFEFYTKVLKAYRQYQREARYELIQSVSRAALLEAPKPDPGLAKYQLALMVRAAVREFYETGSLTVMMFPSVVRMFHYLGIVPDEMEVTKEDYQAAARKLSRRAELLVVRQLKQLVEDGTVNDELRAAGEAHCVRRHIMQGLREFGKDAVEKLFDGLLSTLSDMYNLSTDAKKEAAASFGPIAGEVATEAGGTAEAEAHEEEAAQEDRSA